jgi:hypothetical protein
MTAPAATADVIVNNVQFSTMRQVPLHHPVANFLQQARPLPTPKSRLAHLEEKVFGQGRR